MQDDLDGDEDSMVREDLEEGGFDEIERYLRDVGNNGHRAKTAPLKAGKHAEQFKFTPGFA